MRSPTVSALFFASLLLVRLFSIFLNTFLITELNYLVLFTYIDTTYEPPRVSYGEMFSWQGVKFPKRPNQHDEVFVRPKRSTQQTAKFIPTADVFKKVTVTPEDGVLVIVENVTIIDDYLYGSPRMPFRLNRRIFVIAVTNPEELFFRKRVKTMLKRLWEDYAVADVLLITPCNNDPEVDNRLLI